MDILQLKNLRIYAYHGCHEEERKIGGWFLVSVTVYTDLQAAVISDNLKHAIDYTLIKKIVEQEMAISSNLIEHVAGRIANSIKSHFKNIQIDVEICKERPPFGGIGASVSVKIKR